MTPLTLTLRQTHTRPLDVSALRLPPPERDPASVLARTRIRLGEQLLEAGEIFAFSGTDPQQVEIHSGDTRVHGIGSGMEGGTLTVRGSAGDCLGRGMTGGVLRVEGSCGHFAASALEGGLVEVRGDTGSSLAGAIPGEMNGARGGLVVVRGRAGDRAGDRMRRGLVLMEGGAGDFIASRLRAGTLIALGPVGTAPGLGMRRGTLALSDLPASLPATFNCSGEHELLFLRLLTRHVQHRLGADAPPLPEWGRVRRWVGDRAHGGRGEILVPAP